MTDRVDVRSAGITPVEIEKRSGKLEVVVDMLLNVDGKEVHAAASVYLSEGFVDRMKSRFVTCQRI
jgi:hypothetical protein